MKSALLSFSKKTPKVPNFDNFLNNCSSDLHQIVYTGAGKIMAIGLSNGVGCGVLWGGRGGGRVDGAA